MNYETLLNINHIYRASRYYARAYVSSNDANGQNTEYKIHIQTAARPYASVDAFSTANNMYNVYCKFHIQTAYHPCGYDNVDLNLTNY